jgi:hypothetical protein
MIEPEFKQVDAMAPPDVSEAQRIASEKPPGARFGVTEPIVAAVAVVTVKFPVLAESENVHASQWGFVPNKIDVTLDGEAGLTLRRLVIGARQEHLTYPMRGKLTHVETAADLVRWLVYTVGQLQKLEKDA